MPPPASSPTPRRWVESASAVALLAVPLYFTVFTSRVFEGDKAALLRWLGLGALVALAVTAWNGRQGGRATSPPPFPGTALASTPTPAPAPAPWALRLALALALCLASELAATALSVAPWTSLLGSQTRGQGLATTLAIAVLTLGAASMAARKGGEARLAGFLGLSALPAGLYALTQSMGLDPLPWEGDVVTRVVGPAGASPMLAAHLVLALPFATQRAAEAWRAARREPGWAAAGKLAAWLATVGVGGAALLLSASRGPILGLAAGLWLLGLAAAGGIAAPGRRRSIALTLLATVFLGAAFLAGLNRGAFPALARLPLLDRLSTALDPERNSTRARMRLWEGSMLALGDLAGRPDHAPPARALPPRWRALLGYGPETMDLVWAPVYPPLLAYDEPRGYMPDRAHSLLLDAGLTGGLLGAATQLALLLLGIAAAWGLAAGDVKPPSILWASTATGALLSTLVLRLDGPWCLARSPWPAGACLLAPALGLGLVAGFGLGLAILAWRGPAATTIEAPRANDLVGSVSETWTGSGLGAGGFGVSGFGAAALVALVAHAVELQVSFATVASRLGAWAIIGGLIGIGLRRGRGDHGRDDAPSLQTTVRTDESTQALLASGTIGVTLAFSLAHPGQVAGGPVVAAALIGLGTWGAWLAMKPGGGDGLGGEAGPVGSIGPIGPMRPMGPMDDPIGPRGPIGPMRRSGRPGRLALAIAVYTALQVTLLDRLSAGPADAVGAAAASLSLYVLALASLATLTLAPEEGTASAAPIASRSVPIRRLALVLPTALLVAVPCLAPTVADAGFKEGERGWQTPVSALRADGKGGKAESYLQRALERYGLAARLAPWEPAYPLAQARAHVEYADLLNTRLRLAEGQVDRTASNASGSDTVIELGDADPVDPSAAARWRAARDAQMALALAAIDRAQALAPGSPTPLVTRARGLRVWGQASQATDGRAARLDAALKAYAAATARVPGWPELLDEAAQTALAADRPQEAVDLALEVVLRRDAFFRRAWRSAGLAYEALGDPERAAAAYAAYFVDWRNASDLEALRGQVRALSAAGHVASALDRARRTVQLAPGEAAAHADLATLLEASGDLTGARQSAAAALAISPDDAGIRALAQRVGAGP